MALPFLSNTVIRAITERVLNNVVEQLPKALASGSSVSEPGAAQAIAANAMAIQAVTRDLERLADTLDELDDRLLQVEARMRWRLYGWIAITALVVYAIGFGTAVGLKALDLI